MKVRISARSACLAVFASAILVSSSWAQDITKGSIAGVVRDASGSVVAGAKVDLSGPVGEKSTTTDSLGSYTFPNLTVGPDYSITVTQAGFGSAKSTGLAVGVNQRTTADFRLEVGTTVQSVDVTEVGASSIDLATTTIGANLDESLYKNVAVGRSISSVVNLAPGVSSSGGAGVANPSINGASGLENQYIINGANVTDPGYGGFGNYSVNFGSLGNGITFDFIQEVQVKSGGFEANYGEALGGVVNVITKSGTNTFHGDLYGYFAPRAFTADAPNFLPLVQNKTTYLVSTGRYDFGGDIGGYIKKNKLFFYGGFNPTYSQSFRQASSIYTNSALGTVNIQTQTRNYAGKINWNINANHSVEGSVFGDPASIPVGFTRISSLSTNNNLRQSGLDYGTRTWTTRYNGVFGPTWILTATYSDYNGSQTESPRFNGYQVTDNTPVQLGTGSQLIYNGLGLLQNSQSKNHEVSVVATHLFNAFGGHTLDVGYQYEDVPYNLISRYSGADFVLPNDPALGVAAGQKVFGGTFTRTTSNTKDPTTPIVVYLTRGNYSSPFINTNTKYNAGFIQDSWIVGKRLTIKPGLRFEEQSMAGGAIRYVFAHNWAPRVGLIFDPSGDRKSKFFANWGRFYEKIPSDISVRSFSFESGVRGGAPTPGVRFKDPGPGNAPDPSTANYIPGGTIAQSGGTGNLTSVAGGTASQYQDEIVGGYEHEFSNGVTFTGRFVYRELKRILEDISGINVTQNLAGVGQAYVVSNPSAHLDIFKNAYPCSSGPTCDLDTGYTAGGGDLGADGHPDGFSNPSRVYKAVEFIVGKRFSKNYQLYTSYRLSKLYGNFEGSFRNDNGQSDPNISSLFDYTNTDGVLGYQQAAGILPNNRTNQLKVFGSYQWKAFNFGLSWVLQSGNPLTSLAAHPAYASPGEIPVFPRGNLGTTPVTFPLDLHVDYTYKVRERGALKLTADLFNVANQNRLLYVDTYTQLTGGTPNPDFGKPGVNLGGVAAQPYQTPFYARLSIRYEF